MAPLIPTLLIDEEDASLTTRAISLSSSLSQFFHPTSEGAKTVVYIFLSTFTVIVVLCCMARIANEYRHSYELTEDRVATEREARFCERERERAGRSGSGSREGKKIESGNGNGSGCGRTERTPLLSADGVATSPTSAMLLLFDMEEDEEKNGEGGREAAGGGGDGDGDRNGGGDGDSDRDGSEDGSEDGSVDEFALATKK